MSDTPATFDPSLTVIDEWVNCASEKIRLVNYGAGPDVLEILQKDEWIAEKSYYAHGALCNRIAELVKIYEEPPFSKSIAMAADLQDSLATLSARVAEALKDGTNG